MRNTLLLFVIVFAWAVTSCHHRSKKQTIGDVFSQQLVPIDPKDTNYCCGLPADTFMKSGWKIQYLVKDDSTRYTDLYVKFEKDGRSAVYHGGSLLLTRNYFIPTVAGENDGFIFMEHGCATGCAALLVFSKEDLTTRNFDRVKVYDTATNRVVWIPGNSMAADSFKVTITNLAKAKDTTITFRNLALGSLQETYIDTVIFEKNNTRVVATLANRADGTRQKMITERISAAL